MLARALSIRVAAEALFFACLFAGFYWESTGNSFCNAAGATAGWLQTLHVAILLTAWDAFAGVAGMALAHRFRTTASQDAARLWLSAAIAGIGYYAAQFVLLPSNQAHSFRGVLDCSCFFTERYAIVFLLLTVPMLIVATLLRESLTQRVLSRWRSPEPTR